MPTNIALIKISDVALSVHFFVFTGLFSRVLVIFTFFLYKLFLGEKIVRILTFENLTSLTKRV